MTRIKRLQAIVITVGILSIIKRLNIEKNDIFLFMSIVNSITLYASIEVLLSCIDRDIEVLKSKSENYYNQNRIDLYYKIRLTLNIILVFFIYYINIVKASQISNDIITIFTLSLSMSTDFISGITASIIYKEI